MSLRDAIYFLRKFDIIRHRRIVTGDMVPPLLRYVDTLWIKQNTRLNEPSPAGEG